MQVFKPIRFRPLLGLFLKLVLALFGPLLGTSLGPIRSLLYFGHFGPFWAFLHIHKSILQFTQGRSDHEQIAGKKKKKKFITCFCSTKKSHITYFRAFIILIKILT